MVAKVGLVLLLMRHHLILYLMKVLCLLTVHSIIVQHVRGHSVLLLGLQMLLTEDRAHLLVVASVHPVISVYHVGLLVSQRVLAPLLLAVGSAIGLASLLMILLCEQELALGALLALREGTRVLLLLMLELMVHARCSIAQSVGKVTCHVPRVLLEHIAIDAGPGLMLRTSHLGHARITHLHVTGVPTIVLHVRLLMLLHLLVILLLEMRLLLRSLKEQRLHLDDELLDQLRLVKRIRLILHHLHVMNLLEQMLHYLVALLGGGSLLLIQALLVHLGCLLLLLHHDVVFEVVHQMLIFLLHHGSLLGRLLLCLHLLLQSHLQLVNLLNFLDALLHVGEALRIL